MKFPNKSIFAEVAFLNHRQPSDLRRDCWRPSRLIRQLVLTPLPIYVAIEEGVENKEKFFWSGGFKSLSEFEVLCANQFRIDQSNLLLLFLFFLEARMSLHTCTLKQ